MRKRACADRALSLPNWGAYSRHLDPDEHCPGKRHTQKIERKHLTLRTRIKRLARKTICFSKRPRCLTLSLACLSIAMPLDGQYNNDHLHF